MQYRASYCIVVKLYRYITKILFWVQSFIISRLDYYDSLLTDSPMSFIKPFHLTQNAAARLDFNQPKSDHMTLNTAAFLLCLPVPEHISLKTMMFAYNAKKWSL